MKKLILASGSKYRKELLLRLGLNFECISPDIDEDIWKEKILDPQELTLKLSFEKAKVILDKYPDAVVIGSDQLAHIDGKVLGKTGSLEGSIEQLTLLSNKTHRLITSFCVMNSTKIVIKTNITSLKMKHINHLQIKNYLNMDNPIDCAGSYKLELNGISLFENIDSTDHTAIIGLPLINLGMVLEEFGFVVPPES